MLRDINMESCTKTLASDIIDAYHQKVARKVFRSLVLFLAQYEKSLATKEDVEVTDKNIRNTIASTNYSLTYANTVLNKVGIVLTYTKNTDKLIAKYTGDKDITSTTFLNIGAECLVTTLLERAKEDLSTNGYATITFNDSNHLKDWLVADKVYKTLIANILTELGLKLGVNDKSATIYVDGQYSVITGYNSHE